MQQLSFPEALKRYMRAQKPRITNIMLADRLDLDVATISRRLNGHFTLTEKMRDEMAEAVGSTVKEIWSDGDRQGLNATAGHVRSTPAPRSPDMFSESERKTLPVYGLAAASPLGQMVMSEEPIEWIERPDIVARVPDAYSLIITGTSMIPRYEPGDMVILHPHRPVRQNDHVAIQEIKEGGTHVSVKRFERIDGDHIVTTQYNPPAAVRFRRDQVAAMHRILTQNEILGV